MAQVGVLRDCAVAISRGLRKGGSLLLAAKLLVLSRRLHKKLCAYSSTLKYVESLRVRLGKLRQKLLNLVEERFAAEETEVDLLVDAMCAYALATSSSCADVFRNYLQVRKDTISSTLEDPDSPGAAVRDSLLLWVRTLRDARSLFPRQVPNALAKLQAQPLLQHEDVRFCPELDLDNHGVWIEDEIKFFVPYVRHDDLPLKAATQQASAWARSSLKRLTMGIAASLEDLNQPSTIITLRHEICQLWLSNSGNAHGVSKTQVLNELRSVFQEKMYSLIDQRWQGASGLGELIRQTAEDTTTLEQESHALPGLWDATTVKIDASAEADGFISTINASYRGLTPSLQSTIDRYTLWLSSVDEVRNAIGSLCEERWDDDDFEDALSESDDDSQTRAAHTLLSTDDPKALASRFTSTMTSALDSLKAYLFFSPESSSPINALRATYLLRTLREIVAQLPTSHVPLPTIHTHRSASAVHASESAIEPSASFSALAVPLYTAISSPLLDALFARHQRLVRRLSSTEQPIRGRELWDDGTPPLPMLPSPAAFRLLRELHKALDSAGPDLWTAPSMHVLKAGLRRKLADALATAENEEKNNEEQRRAADTEAEPANASPSNRSQGGSKDVGDKDDTQTTSRLEASIQRLFDLDLLIAASTSSRSTKIDTDKKKSVSEDEEPLDSLRQRWLSKLDLKPVVEEAGISARLRQSVMAFWTRTGLLFGLLYEPGGGQTASSRK